MIIERKTSSNLCVTSAQPLRFLAILSAVLVMSLANIGVMWGEDNTRTIFLDISQCGWYLNDGYEPRIWVSKNDAKTDTYEIDYTEVVTTNVYRFEIDKGARCIQFMRYKNGDKQNWSGDIWINNASSGSNCCYTYHNYFKLDNNAATVSDVNKTSFSSSGEYLYFYADNLTTTTNVAFLLGRWNYTAAQHGVVEVGELLIYQTLAIILLPSMAINSILVLLIMQPKVVVQKAQVCLLNINQTAMEQFPNSMRLRRLRNVILERVILMYLVIGRLR